MQQKPLVHKRSVWEKVRNMVPSFLTCLSLMLTLNACDEDDMKTVLYFSKRKQPVNVVKPSSEQLFRIKAKAENVKYPIVKSYSILTENVKISCRLVDAPPHVPVKVVLYSDFANAEYLLSGDLLLFSFDADLNFINAVPINADGSIPIIH